MCVISVKMHQGTMYKPKSFIQLKRLGAMIEVHQLEN